MEQPWERAIILVDMNAFFASVEQLDHPELRGKPIGITNGAEGTCIITCSYEARAFGIRTGMRLREARQRCPEFIVVPSNPHRYVAISTAIMQALHSITPDVEVFSIDEAFLDVSRCQRLLGPPAQIGSLVKQTVYETSGLYCSVGVAGDKTTAKWAAKQQKPDGLTVVPPWQAAERLREVPLTELCGIAKGIGSFLAERGIHRCGQMASLPVGELSRRFGNLGRRIWLMAQGKDPSPVETRIAAPKSIGHGKVMPPGTRDRELILNYLDYMSFKVGARLRRHQLVAREFAIGLRADTGWLGGHYMLSLPGNDGGQIFRLCRLMLERNWRGEPVHQVQITASDPRPQAGQLELFAADSEPAGKGNAVMDAVNERFGEYTLTPARLLNRGGMNNVIAPAWRPGGHRKT
ncbi:MAG: DNA polymerase IV, partial [Gammaproteobacteria bacterium]|nr:DNA polymerase IV [Gammaproteobacteria bacterium]